MLHHCLLCVEPSSPELLPAVPQATPERLLDHLLEESVDDTFHKDFLLTYRTFLKSPAPIVKKLQWAWHHGLPEQREKVRKRLL